MRLLTLAFTILAFTACKEIKKEAIQPKMEEETTSKEFPETIFKIFEAHGGFDTYITNRVLSFEIPKDDMTEAHTIDLKTRNEKITMGDIAMGYDGSEFWLLDEKGEYKGDPIFYHNLIFYFYNMPFVLADDGIHYEKTESLEFEGKNYPGIKISYDAGIGSSSKDEYFIYYNPETFQMEWLGYTVTYRSNEKSDNVRWIRYIDWMNVDGLTLPKSITWYAYEGRTIKEAKNTVSFENVILAKTKKSDTFFAKPENAKVVTKE
ncbi:DUF6503 family protein [Maribacter halichondriae]|uniref:DUF6503 family protein n=1 Tax=Maribacter halichondriae TaxID=2980554 RepID=UPI002358AD63|nr:DUF6503 family protein [Maribacter sp. Hal144]